MKLKKEIKIDETNIDLETVVNNCICSTTEKVIGKWSDGKPIYRKIIDLGTLPNATPKTVTHNISVDTPIKCSGIVKNTQTGVTFTVPMVNIDIWADKNSVVIQPSTDRTVCIGTAIFEYTKTTD